VKTIRLKSCLSEEEVGPLLGTFLGDDHYDRLVNADTRVYKPDGSLLLVFRRRVLPPALCKSAYPALKKAARKAGNRGLASGKEMDVSKMMRQNRPAVPHSPGSRARIQPLKLDGTLSNTDYAPTDVPSGIIGHFDRVVRFPYCRLTSFNMYHPQMFNARVLPLLQAIDGVFRSEVPERYAAQKAVVENTTQDFIIHGTSFSTITVNKSWVTAAHTDKGDFREGFGVMSAIDPSSFDGKSIAYGGCYLIFPRYRVAVDMRTGDVLLADVHEIHGNSPITGIRGTYERISIVCYFRKQMMHCGTAQEEMERAKRRKRGDKLIDHLNDEVEE
jgi:hypothetical protein